MKPEITNCLTWYANQIAETVQYTNWPDEFCRGEIKRATDRFVNELKKYIDFNNLTKEEAQELRFGKWRDDEPDLYLVPLYLLPILPIGTKLICINGDEIVYDGKNIDNDVRFGCLAYGVRVKLDKKGEGK